MHIAPSKGSRTLLAMLEMLRTPELSITLFVVAMAMVVNWMLEAEKWRKLILPLQPVGRTRAFVATIAGTSVALITPNRTGEFAGRIMFLEPGHRISGAVATMWGGVAQFVITAVFGVMAMLVYGIIAGPVFHFTEFLMSGMAILAVIIAFLYMRPIMVERLLLRIPQIGRLRAYLSVLEGYSVKELMSILFLSFIRYLVFSAQFVLLLVTMDASVDLVEAIVAVPVIFLITSIVPTVLLTEIGVRGTVAMAILAPMGAGDPNILMATFALWAINLLLPAIAGSFILLFAKIRLKNTA